MEDSAVDSNNCFSKLPNIAWQCLIESLVSLGSSGLVELMRCSKTTRQLVLQHANSISFTPQLNIRSHKLMLELHSVATRKADLFLTLNLESLDSHIKADELLRQARFKSSQVGHGWTAVTKLRIYGLDKVGLTNFETRAMGCLQ